MAQSFTSQPPGLSSHLLLLHTTVTGTAHTTPPLGGNELLFKPTPSIMVIKKKQKTNKNLNVALPFYFYTVSFQKSKPKKGKEIHVSTQTKPLQRGYAHSSSIE